MLSDLEAEALPSELRVLAQTAIGDEHRHVDWCLRWARCVDVRAPTQATFAGTRPLAFDGASEHDNRLLRTVFGCCFSETVAVHVLFVSHARIKLGSVRRLNQQHLREEVGHSRLGWALLGWSGISQRDRHMIRSYVPDMTALTRSVWQSDARTGGERLEALGYLSSRIIAGACQDAIDSVIVPGLERLGI